MSTPHEKRRARTLGLVLVAASLGCARTSAEWQDDLDHPDPFVRGMAAIGLSFQSPPHAGPALHELLRTIDRVDVGLEREAARALVHVGPLHVPALLEHLLADDLRSADGRRALKDALAAAGPAATGPVIACMRGRGRHLVGDLGEILLAVGAPALPWIVEMLAEEDDVRLQNYAAFLLAWMGPRAEAALPTLRAAASAPDPDLRRMASEAIASIEGRPWQVPKPGAENRGAEETGAEKR